MIAEVLHCGFDGLRFTIQTDIPPELRVKLALAKATAIETNQECALELNGMLLAVRRSGGSAFSAHTGEYGAEWYFLDPENRPANNPGVTVDFRAFLLATGGLKAAERHFRECMEAFGIPYVETQLKVARVDLAIDILAPWFAPDREDLVLPPGTRITENTGVDESQTTATGARVTGLRAGAIGNRQLSIYDKRNEIILKGKMGWLEIWNHARAHSGKPPLDLNDRDQSLVWRFELRLGSKQLRNRWEMRSWDDLNAMIGDAFVEFTKKIRYCVPTKDQNRSRWPTHELWQIVEEVVKGELHNIRSGVVPDDVKKANRAEHMDMLDGMILGLIISRAAAEGVKASGFEGFARLNLKKLQSRSKHHPIPLDERLAKASCKYRFR
jgi:hypothetical protein